MSKELITTFKPYELLKQEQSSSKVERDFEIVDFEFICEKNKRYKVYGKDNLEMFYSDDFFVKNFDKITQKFFINIHPKKDLPFGPVCCMMGASKGKGDDPCRSKSCWGAR